MKRWFLLLAINEERFRMNPWSQNDGVEFDASTKKGNRYFEVESEELMDSIVLMSSKGDLTGEEFNFLFALKKLFKPFA